MVAALCFMAGLAAGWLLRIAHVAYRLRKTWTVIDRLELKGRARPAQETVRVPHDDSVDYGGRW